MTLIVWLLLPRLPRQSYPIKKQNGNNGFQHFSTTNKTSRAEQWNFNFYSLAVKTDKYKFCDWLCLGDTGNSCRTVMLLLRTCSLIMKHLPVDNFHYSRHLLDLGLRIKKKYFNHYGTKEFLTVFFFSGRCIIFQIKSLILYSAVSFSFSDHY